MMDVKHRTEIHKGPKYYIVFYYGMLLIVEIKVFFAGCLGYPSFQNRVSYESVSSQRTFRLHSLTMNLEYTSCLFFFFPSLTGRIAWPLLRLHAC